RIQEALPGRARQENGKGDSAAVRQTQRRGQAEYHSPARHDRSGRDQGRRGRIKADECAGKGAGPRSWHGTQDARTSGQAMTRGEGGSPRALFQGARGRFYYSSPRRANYFFSRILGTAFSTSTRAASFNSPDRKAKFATTFCFTNKRTVTSASLLSR